jgi:ribose transport system substrate-binding protein
MVNPVSLAQRRRTLKSMNITGLGPHGEIATPPERLTLNDVDAQAARQRRFTVAVVLHTTKSDWSKQQLSGIVTSLGQYSAAVVDVVDCQFSVDTQIQELNRLISEAPDAIISIPIGNTAVAEAHRNVSHSGIKLLLMDNVPTGLLPGTDYVTVVSADNFGLGQIAAKALSRHLPQGGKAGIVSYGVDFFATNEREIAFRRWIETERSDVTVVSAKFIELDFAGALIDGFLNVNPNVDGLFAVWDEPAIQVLSALRGRGRELPITTVDLGNETAIEMAKGGLIKGIGAQRPYDQGSAIAEATIKSLIGARPPSWIALPGLSVTAENVIEAYQLVWHSPAPPALRKAYQAARTK